MNILFLGFLYDDNDEIELLNNSTVGLQSASNKFQWNIVKGLDECLERPITVFSTLPAGTYPFQCKQLMIKTCNWHHAIGSYDIKIGYLNIFFLKQINRFFSFFVKIQNWLRSHHENRKIIIYSLYTPFLLVIGLIKRMFKNVHVSLIVPDLPFPYGIIITKNKIHWLMQFLDAKIKLKLLKSIDSFVLITEKMKEPLNIGEKPYVVLEGSVDSSEGESESGFTQVDHQENERKAVLYSGTLHYEFGIKTLLDAFSQIEQNDYELWLCGHGDAENEIKDLAIRDNRVKFFGFITQSDVQILQHRATALINPRQNIGRYTAYSFPSKTFEYMLSGTPVIMYRLDGISNEYDRYLHYVEGNDVLYLKNKILEVCEQSKVERDIFGAKAREFVMQNKNHKMQAKKIIDMIFENRINCSSE